MDMTGVISSQQGSGNYITCEFQKSLAETMTMMFAMDQIDYRQISQIRQALECLAIFACNRECNRWSDRRNGESSKGTGSESG